MYFRKVIHDLLLALRLPLRVVVHRVPEAGESFFPCARASFVISAVMRSTSFQPDLMDLRRRDVHCGHHLHGFGIAPLAIRQGFDRKLAPSLWVVIGAQEFREFLVSGERTSSLIAFVISSVSRFLSRQKIPPGTSSSGA